MKSTFHSSTRGLGGIKERCGKSPFLCWTFGLAIVLGLPLGLFVAIAEGSLLVGFGSTIAVIVIGLLVCRKEIIGEYRARRSTPTKE